MILSKEITLERSINSFLKNKIYMEKLTEFDFSQFIYKNNRTKSITICKKCKESTLLSITNIKNRVKRKGFLTCEQCYIKPDQKTKKTNEEFIQEVFNLVGDEYTFLEDYICNKTPILLRHNICGKEYKKDPNHFLGRNVRCTDCGTGKGYTKSNKQFIEKVFELVGDEYTFLEDIQGVHTEIKYVHNVCGEINKIRPSNFLYNNSRCPICVTHGFDSSKKAILYYIKLKTIPELYKVGVTNKTVEERFNKTEQDMMDIIFTVNYEDGKEAIKMERKILENFDLYRLSEKPSDFILHTGWSECFTQDILGEE